MPNLVICLTLLRFPIFRPRDPPTRNELVSAVNRSPGFSILADETADIFGTEQLSIGVRFFDLSSEKLMHEEFLGLAILTA